MKSLKAATLTAVMATGYAGGLATSTLTAQEGADLARDVHVKTALAPGNKDLEDFRALVEELQCPAVEEKEGLEKDECSLEDGTVTSIFWGQPRVLESSFVLSGSWVKKTP